MRQSTTFEMLVFAILAFKLLDCCLACNNNRGMTKLANVKHFTFNGSGNNGLNSGGNLLCVNGTARCEFEVKQAICYNTGAVHDGGEIKWNCRSSDLKFPYRFGITQVLCSKPGIPLSKTRPDDYISNESNCGLVYSVEFVGDIFAYGLLAGLGLLYGCFFFYKSPSSSETSRLKNLWDWLRGPHTIFTLNRANSSDAQTGGSAGDGYKVISHHDARKTMINLNNWTGTVTLDGNGRGDVLPQSYRGRGPHSIGTTYPNAANNLTGGNSAGGDMGNPHQSESKAEIDEENWKRAVNLDLGGDGQSRQSFRTRTSARSSVTLIQSSPNGGAAWSRR